MRVIHRLVAITLALLFAVGCASTAAFEGENRRRRRSLPKPEPKKVAKLVESVTLVSQDGEVEEFDSNDYEITQESVRIPTIIFRNPNYLCATDSENEAIALRQQEIDLELAFLIKSLNRQKPAKTANGEYKRSLTKSMITNLYNTPDCAPYRFKLNIVKRLLKGDNIEKIEESIVR